jgi:hypothetical protein
MEHARGNDFMYACGVDECSNSSEIRETTGARCLAREHRYTFNPSVPKVGDIVVRRALLC